MSPSISISLIWGRRRGDRVLTIVYCYKKRFDNMQMQWCMNAPKKCGNVGTLGFVWYQKHKCYVLKGYHIGLSVSVTSVLGNVYCSCYAPVKKGYSSMPVSSDMNDRISFHYRQRWGIGTFDELLGRCQPSRLDSKMTIKISYRF